MTELVAGPGGGLELMVGSVHQTPDYVKPTEGQVS